MQEWTALRAQGIQTPQIAVWQRLPILPDSTFANTARANAIYNYVLNVYRSAAFQDVSASMISLSSILGAANYGMPVQAA